MEPFYTRCPDVAEAETRRIQISESHSELSAGDYHFIEFYCTDRKCDCRRVLLNVCEASRMGLGLASINFGWESEEFYTRWMHGDDEMARQVRGAELDPLNRNGAEAEALLDLFRTTLLPDQAYVSSLARHYRMFKRKGRGRSWSRKVRTGG